MSGTGVDASGQSTKGVAEQKRQVTHVSITEPPRLRRPLTCRRAGTAIAAALEIIAALGGLVAYTVFMIGTLCDAVFCTSVDTAQDGTLDDTPLDKTRCRNVTISLCSAASRYVALSHVGGLCYRKIV
jgi:hypothetical protein